MYSVVPRYFMYGLGLVSLKKAIKKKDETIEVPSFRGIVEVKHKMKGRIRFRIPSLKGNEEGFEEVTKQFKRIDSITNIESNAVIGSLLVEYSDDIEPTLIVGILIKLLGFEEHIKNKPASFITRELKGTTGSISLAIDEKTNGLFDLKSLLFVIFTLAGISKIIRNPKITPAGFTYLWWGYSVLKL